MTVRYSKQVLATFAFALFAAAPASASDLIVEVRGIRSSGGQIGCALFARPEGFPREPGRALQQHWAPTKPTTMTCRFEAVKPGTYAVAVTHDLNSNFRTDSNFLGRPTEDWGVSNDVRPSLRAPRFDEAAFVLTDTPTSTIVIRLSR